MGRSLIVIMCLLSFVGTLCAQQNAPRSYVADGKTITYRNGIDKLLNHFPGDHVLTLSERDSDARDFILKHFPRSNPSVVHADFDGDGHPDYAMLLRDLLMPLETAPRSLVQPAPGRLLPDTRRPWSGKVLPSLTRTSIVNL